VLQTLAVENYRSLRDLVLPLSSLNVVTGANGSGKSSLYRSLRLLADASRNGAVAALAREGGLPSTLWAGPETVGRAVLSGRTSVQGTVRSRPVALRLGFAGDEFGYAMDLGLPSVSPGSSTMFGLDPEIKVEAIWTGPVCRASAMLCERHGGAVRVRDNDGEWVDLPRLSAYDSVLGQLADAERAPEVLVVREQLRSWRFYDQFRTDTHAPARLAQVGTRTPVLSHDGADLAAALQTIREIGDAAEMDAVVDRALPGSRVDVFDSGGRFELALHQQGMLRPLGSEELSDGTLRFLLLVAALLSPRPPALLVLNEPETSLHPDLLPALGELIRVASTRTQVIAVSHAQTLVSALAKGPAGAAPATVVELTKEYGQTTVVGRERFDAPLWHWPKR
jgi:predicted ATPase